jgi:hypothetical protein
MAIFKFAVVIDQDVAGTISMDTENKSDVVPRMIAALSSDPKIIPAPEEVDYGWMYDGQNFFKPSNQ